MAINKASTSTTGLRRMAAALAAFTGLTVDDNGQVRRKVRPLNYGPVGDGKNVATSKGKRSRRRRAGYMRAMGCKHVDGFGWVTPEDRAHEQQ